MSDWLSLCSDMASIKLMKHEYEWPITDISPITAISFYTVNETDLDKTIAFLTKRFQRIVQVNPWLSGRLKQQQNDGKKESEVFLTYEKESVADKSSDMFTVREDDKVFEFSDWSSLTNYLSEFKPKKGSECIDQDEMLSRLIVFKKSSTTGTNTIGVMFCLNHCIGDGWTFYRLWHMLDKDEVVEQMTVERIHDIKEEVERSTNLQHISDASTGTMKFLLGKVGKGIKRKITGKSPPRKFMYKVRRDAIVERKNKFNEDDCFVSTNDILCSWFFELCDPNHGLVMMVNVRKRVPEVQDNMAGNYVFGCAVNFTDIKTPADFRGRWKGITSKKLPADVVDRSSSCNQASSWLDVYQHVEIEGGIHLKHIPVLSTSDFGGSVWGIPLTSECTLIPFHFNKEDVGVIISAYNDEMTEDYFNSCELLDGEVGNLLSEVASPPKQPHCDL